VTLAVLYPHRRLLPARVKAFADFAVSRVAAEIDRRLEGTAPPSMAKPRKAKGR
jgi:hypothetical protein